MYDNYNYYNGNMDENTINNINYNYIENNNNDSKSINEKRKHTTKLYSNKYLRFNNKEFTR